MSATSRRDMLHAHQIAQEIASGKVSEATLSSSLQSSIMGPEE